VDHVEDFDVRAILLAGTRRAVLFDTLAHPRAVAGIPKLVANLKPTVVYSHADWDHCWGTAGLPPDWRDIVAHRACSERFLVDVPRTLAEKSAAAGSDYGGLRLCHPSRTFDTDIELDLGGACLHLRHLPGHTLDSVVGHVPEWGLFLAGDAVESPVPFLNPESPLPTWVAGLERWHRELGEAETAPVVIPSHGPVGGLELLESTLDYLEALLAGEVPQVPDRMSPFYRSTHERSLALARRWEAT